MQETTGPAGTAAGSTAGTTAETIIAIAQVVAVVIVIAVIALLAYKLIHIGTGPTTLRPGDRSWLDYGSFYVVTLGIAAVVVGFLVVLLFAGSFEDITQALAFLTALFGAITGLVGTYFGVKSSSDARAGAERLTGGGGFGATITIAPTDATANLGAEHTVTATVITAGGSSAADEPVIFTVIDGPDSDILPQVKRTDPSGQASFTFTNGGEAGTDTIEIEAAALGAKGTATVTFSQ